jgi:hypothetical protein
MTLASTWTKTTQENWKIGAKAPKILGWELSGEYGQQTTDSQGGTTTQMYQSDITNTISTVTPPCVHHASAPCAPGGARGSCLLTAACFCPPQLPDDGCLLLPMASWPHGCWLVRVWLTIAGYWEPAGTQEGKTQHAPAAACSLAGCRYYNCSATGEVTTRNVIFTQDFKVTMSMTCGPNRDFTWTSSLKLSGVMARSQTVAGVIYNP